MKNQMFRDLNITYVGKKNKNKNPHWCFPSFFFYMQTIKYNPI